MRFKEQPSLSELSQVSLVPESKIEIKDSDEEERHLFFEIKPSEMIPLLQRIMAKFSLLDMSVEEQSLESVIERLYAAGSAGKLPHTS